MHAKKRDLLWQTRIIMEVYFFVVKEGAGGPTHTVGEWPKVKRRICAMKLENAEGGWEACGCVHAREKVSASYKDKGIVWV